MVFATDAMHVPRRLARWLRGCDWRIDQQGVWRPGLLGGVDRLPRAGQPEEDHCKVEDEYGNQCPHPLVHAHFNHCASSLATVLLRRDSNLC